MNKPKRRIKKSVRKTVGALFLASSVIVAAIPTTSYQGGATEAATFTDAPDYALRYELGQASGLSSTDSRKSTVDTLLTSSNTSVPFIKPVASLGNPDDITDVTVYTSEDSLYQFAYVSMEGRQNEDGNEKFAFILKYNTPGSLPNGQLTIPNTVDAYLAYNTNDGSSTAANVAVGKSGNYLFYEETREVTDYDVTGNVTGTHTEYAYRPCYASARSDWAGIADENLYWFDTTDMRPGTDYTNEFSATQPSHLTQVGTDQAHQRISNAPVRFIANQYIEVDSTGNLHIKKITDSSQGIFSGNGNIQHLTTGGNLNGIGDYAFYACTGLQSFKFSNGLSAIGNHSFEYCSSLKEIDIPGDTNLRVIGAYAFKNCTTLQSFTVPTSVSLLCDGVFQNCGHMSSCTLYGTDVASSALRYLGNGVFYGCSDLTELEFPEYYTESDVNISNFKNCYSLEKIITHNTEMDFIDDSEETQNDKIPFTFQDFLGDLSPNFYMAGVETGTAAQETAEAKWGLVHQTCRDNHIAYNYIPTDYFEKTITEEGGGTARYLVDGNNNLEFCDVKGTVYTLNLPEYIGPNYIKAIGDGAFANKCSLVLVSIPSTIESIGKEAFKGCHNLQYVYFDTDTVTIGDDAFATQDTSAHSDDCVHGTGFTGGKQTINIDGRTFELYDQAHMTTSSNKPAIQLYFVGTIDSNAEPYKYAMSLRGKYSYGSQTRSFIRFLSGYPTCQEIEFVLDSDLGDTGKATLVDFPIKSDTSDLYNPNNPKTSYLTLEQKDAIHYAETDYNNGQATEDQVAFLNATKNLVVPLGVDAIKDGLFHDKTTLASDAMEVTLYGIDVIEAEYSIADPATATDDNGDVCPPVVTIDPDKSDFAGCPNLLSVTLKGDAQKTIQDGAFYDCDGLTDFEAYCPIDRIGQNAFGNDAALKTFTTLSTVGTIADHCCTGDPLLETVALNGGVQSIEKHAFEDCVALTDVNVADNLNNMGVAPFRGCEALANVEFNGNPRYTCDGSIIYSTDSNGNKTVLIECLEGRREPKNGGPYINSTETSGITAISTEAFAECQGIREVDLTKSLIDEIPTNCFEDTTDLRNVKLPYTCDTLSDYAFDGSSVEYIEGTQYLTIIDVNALDHMTSTGWDPSTKSGDHGSNSSVTICAPDDSYFSKYGTRNGYTVTSAPKVEYFDVKFFDYTDSSPTSFVQVGTTQSILSGSDAVPPTPHGRDGYIFKEWSPSYQAISDNTSCYAVYETEPDDYNKHTVTFYYDSGYTTLLKTCYISNGQSAASEAPLTDVMSRLGEDEYFRGWIGGDITNITADTRFYADISDVPAGSWKVNYYSFDGSTLLFTTTVKNGQSAPSYQAPAVDGYTFIGWSGDLSSITKDTVTVAQYKANDGSQGNPSGNTGTNNNNGSNGNGSTANATYYTLTVVNGSGSGSYIAGANVVIMANDPGNGKAFGNWSISPSTAPIASKAMSATVVTMPSENVTVTANYVAATAGNGNNGAGGNGSGGNGNGNNTNYWPSTGNVPRSSGTTVVIDKNGLSNTGVVSATVNGSTDNFTIKITESQTANKLVLDALLKKYGTLDNIIYFPFDISLYDAAGTTQITDTSGLTITITIPIPDSMTGYAANNKVAVITNNEIDPLNARFTTINGVPCVTFTCTHFSPYVIYVNTVEMTAGSDGSGAGNGLDNTPKTADPIHPKWFVSIALFAISIVLFVMKDKKALKPVKADNVRAPKRR